MYDCNTSVLCYRQFCHGVTKSQTWLSDFAFTFHFSLSCIGEGNGSPLQCSCLENPRDGGAWWAAVDGVAQSRTGLKWFSSSSSHIYYRDIHCLPEVWVKIQSLVISFTQREGNGNPLQDSCLENNMDRGAWWAAVHGVVKSRTRLSNFTFTFHFHALEKMATHPSVLAWRIPGTVEPVGLPSRDRTESDTAEVTAAAEAAAGIVYIGYHSCGPFSLLEPITGNAYLLKDLFKFIA